MKTLVQRLLNFGVILFLIYSAKLWISMSKRTPQTPKKKLTKTIGGKKLDGDDVIMLVVFAVLGLMCLDALNMMTYRFDKNLPLDFTFTEIGEGHHVTGDRLQDITELKYVGITEDSMMFSVGYGRWRSVATIPNKVGETFTYEGLLKFIIVELDPIKIRVNRIDS